MNIEKIRKTFNEKKYAFLDDFVDPDDAKNLAQEILMHSLLADSSPDAMVNKSPSLRDLECTDRLLELLMPHIEEYTGLNLLPTYAYSRVYLPGETLKAHTDRPSCEISVTLTLDLDGEPWEIFMADPTTEDDAEKVLEGYNMTWPVKNIAGFKMKSGQGVLYKGEELVHWRDEYKTGNRQIQVFLHYVDANGPHAHNIYDGRPNLVHKNPNPTPLKSFYPIQLVLPDEYGLKDILGNMQMIHSKMIESSSIVNKLMYKFDTSDFTPAHMISVKCNEWITPDQAVRKGKQHKLTVIMPTDDCTVSFSNSITMEIPFKKGTIVTFPSFLSYKIIEDKAEMTAIIEMHVDGSPFR